MTHFRITQQRSHHPEREDARCPTTSAPDPLRAPLDNTAIGAGEPATNTLD